MSDITDPATRSRMMAAIRARDTSPELAVRHALHERGFRYRLHLRHLPGRPDIVLPRYRAVIFVNGCFWHRHGCANSRLPTTRQDFWRNKLETNVARDDRNRRDLEALGWRIATVWECEIRTAQRDGSTDIYDRLSAWLKEKEGETGKARSGYPPIT